MFDCPGSHDRRRQWYAPHGVQRPNLSDLEFNHVVGGHWPTFDGFDGLNGHMLRRRSRGFQCRLVLVAAERLGLSLNVLGGLIDRQQWPLTCRLVPLTLGDPC